MTSADKINDALTSPPTLKSSCLTPQKCGRILFVILAIICLAGAGVGVASFGVYEGWWELKVFSILTKTYSVALILVGTGGSFLLFCIALIRCREKERLPGVSTETNFDRSQKDPIQQEVHNNSYPHLSNPVIEIFTPPEPPQDTARILGPQAYTQAWGIEVVGAVPGPPKINWDEQDRYFKEPIRDNYYLLYIPARVRHQGQIKPMNLASLQTMGPYNYTEYNETLDSYGKDVRPGWVLISTRCIPNSTSKLYRMQKDMLQSPDTPPHPLQIATLIFLAYALKKEKLYTGVCTTSSVVRFGLPLLVGNFEVTEKPDGTSGAQKILICDQGLLNEATGISVVRPFNEATGISVVRPFSAD